jgi:hypothetical protein
MIPAISRIVMRLATCCLGEARREWALAMQAEFEEANKDRTTLAFACGCLLAAWRDLPRHVEGRLGIASHVIALGLLIPLALYQFGGGLGSWTAHGALDPVPLPGEAQRRLIAMPTLHILWLILGAGQLRLAWVLLERDWDRVAKAGALIAAAAVTIFLFMGVLLLDTGPLMGLAAGLALETIFILLLARWHARFFLNTSPATAAR